MNRERALSALRDLKEEARTSEVINGGEELTAWKSKVRAVMVASLGAHDDLLSKFDDVRYELGAWSSATPESAWDNARKGGIRSACGLIDAAIYQLEILAGDDEPVDERSYDPELWDHVQGLVEAEDWGKVASQTAIFVENQVRQWAGVPTDLKTGEPLYGKTLFAKALANDAELRLGARSGEWEGWRYLGMGFAQAIGNVDRHRIQKRDDARRYAIGVLGLASLLLTQIRYEHADSIEDE